MGPKSATGMAGWLIIAVIEWEELKAVQVLLVEDDDLVASMVADQLTRQEDWAVARCTSLAEAAAWASGSDIVLLDLNLSDSRGAASLTAMRQILPHAPIIVISAIDAPGTRVETLSDGADDYVTKPFQLDELQARMTAVLRRAHRAETGTAGVIWDPRARSVQVSGQPVDLTPLEYEVFRTLAESPGAAFSRADILARVMGPNFYGYERVVDVHVGHLRKKLAQRLPGDIIETVRAFGYRWSREIPVQVLLND